MLYKIAGKAFYAGDVFVQLHTTQFTQITPYLSFVRIFTSLFGIDNLPNIFLVLHSFSLVLLYLAVRLLYRALGIKNELLTAIGVAGLFLVCKVGVIPADRWLFTSVMDPELFVFPFMIFAVGCHLKQKYYLAAVFLFIANTLYPVYAIFFYGALIVCLACTNITTHKNKIVISVAYSFAVFPYLLFVYVVSKGTSNVDVSPVIEILRAPHHYTIYNIYDLPWKFFFLLGAAIVAVGATIRRNVSVSESFRQMEGVLSSLAVVLLLVSLVATFVRWPLMIQIAPYRIGVTVVVFAWVGLTASFFLLFKKKAISPFSRKYTNTMAFALMAIASIVLVGRYHVNTPFTANDRGEVLEWLQENTVPEALFLNYSDLPIRTAALRPMYFSFKTIPLVADAQRDWYERFRVQYDMHEIEAPESVDGVREARRRAFTKYDIDIAEVIDNLDAMIDYVVIQNPETIAAHDYINGINIKTFNTEGLERVFSHGRYTVYKVVK